MNGHRPALAEVSVQIWQSNCRENSFFKSHITSEVVLVGRMVNVLGARLTATFIRTWWLLQATWKCNFYCHSFTSIAAQIYPADGLARHDGDRIWQTQCMIIMVRLAAFFKFSFLRSRPICRLIWHCMEHLWAPFETGMNAQPHCSPMPKCGSKKAYWQPTHRSSIESASLHHHLYVFYDSMENCLFLVSYSTPLTLPLLNRNDNGNVKTNKWEEQKNSREARCEHVSVWV